MTGNLFAIELPTMYFLYTFFQNITSMSRTQDRADSAEVLIVPVWYTQYDT